MPITLPLPGGELAPSRDVIPLLGGVGVGKKPNLRVSFK